MRESKKTVFHSLKPLLVNAFLVNRLNKYPGQGLQMPQAEFIPFITRQGLRIYLREQDAARIFAHYGENATGG